MEKVYRENEGKLENKGNLDNEGKPEDEVQSENEGQSNEKEKLEVERKSEQEPEVQNERKPDNERQPAGEGKQEKQGKSEAERNPLREGKRESQAKPESQSHAAEKRPAEDYVPRKAKRKTDRTIEDSPTDCKEDTPVRHLDPEEMIRGADELERLREEIRRVRNKFVMMHWKQRHSRSRPYPVCFRP
ncbi:transcription elongation factor A protein-like 8 [Budorcas taxicolor]|uniref:transcription elongation factor A protein-like 8 n=1 Tax=Budorcas taxicolor TaxID=37181 RepID=UPI0022845087|nr:transcription elongation factor A protein-like 8 [Budorcas taxicolor]